MRVEGSTARRHQSPFGLSPSPSPGPTRAGTLPASPPHQPPAPPPPSDLRCLWSPHPGETSPRAAVLTAPSGFRALVRLARALRGAPSAPASPPSRVAGFQGCGPRHQPGLQPAPCALRPADRRAPQAQRHALSGPGRPLPAAAACRTPLGPARTGPPWAPASRGTHSALSLMPEPAQGDSSA